MLPRLASVLFLLIMYLVPFVIRAQEPIIGSGVTGGQGGIPFYFNTSSGLDTNNCHTPTTACQTISHLNAIALPPSARVLFAGGQTFNGGISLTIANVPQGPVSFGSYGGGSATISSGLSACLLAANISDVMVNGLTCTANNASNTTAGISIINALGGNKTLSGPTIANNTVSGYGANGIEVLGTSGSSGFSGITVNSNVVHDVTGNSGTIATRACIEIDSPSGTNAAIMLNVNVAYNLVYNCNGTAAASSNWTGSGIFVAETTGAIMQYNVAHDFGANNAASNGPVGIWTYQSSNVTIQFNEVYNGKSTTTDGDGFDCDGLTSNCVIQYNFAHDNYGSGLLVCAFASAPVSNNTIRYNISQNNGVGGGTDTGGIEICDEASDVNLAVYNNTVYAGVSGLALQEIGTVTPTMAHVANNILFGVAGKVLVNWATSPSAATAVSNDYYPAGVSIDWASKSYATLAAWRAATGQEELGGVSVGLATTPSVYVPGGGFIGSGSGYDPGYLMAYNLQATSAMAGAGADLDAQFSINPGAQDFYGKAILATGGTYPVGAAVGDFAAFGASCTQSSNFLARTTSFTKANNVNYNSIICGMVSDGYFSSLDMLYLLAAPNLAAAELNIVSTNYGLTEHGTCTVSSNQGITGDGSSCYFDTGFVPSTAGGHWQLNSTSAEIYNLTNGGGAGNITVFGAQNSGATSFALGYFNSPSGNYEYFINDDAGTDASITTVTGVLAAQRTVSNSVLLWQNGVQLTPAHTATSVAVPAFSIYLFAYNSGSGAGQFSAQELSAAMFGSGSVSLLQSSLRLNSFMTALGINVY